MEGIGRRREIELRVYGSIQFVQFIQFHTIPTIHTMSALQHIYVAINSLISLQVSLSQQNKNHFPTQFMALFICRKKQT